MNRLPGKTDPSCNQQVLTGIRSTGFQIFTVVVRVLSAFLSPYRHLAIAACAAVVVRIRAAQRVAAVVVEAYAVVEAAESAAGAAVVVQDRAAHQVAAVVVEACALVHAAASDAGAAVVVGIANLGHPKFVAFPNACSFASHSSYVEVFCMVFVRGSIDVLPNDAPCNHSSNLRVSVYEKMEFLDSNPNLSCSALNDTSVLPTDATTSHCRKRCPPPRQGQRRHTSQVSL